MPLDTTSLPPCPRSQPGPRSSSSRPLWEVTELSSLPSLDLVFGGGATVSGSSAAPCQPTHTSLLIPAYCL